ncbi:SHOCT domain-containing protein [Natronolimnobius sp. AArcel1]|uniref:SHOCT domain-containing protein n=1 Tax=Natronolimnobius sp. AArcel1 TaxID=1679093 RepID=UPI0013EAD1CF|nr:SHOCT domain-containing protein [Natronolimnobius sp. AArcel1]NGM70941.1 SHOCT domain-containing protein [Natronolimnobius sp. AArcel1]
MASDSGGRDYNLTELFALKFVLADVVIIAALLLAGPWVAVAITALFVLSFILLWYLTRPADDTDEPEQAVDPVTQLQQRYAAGELSESEFEHRLDRLVESNERADRAGVDTDELELEYERSD